MTAPDAGRPDEPALDVRLDPRLDQAPCGFVAFDDDGVVRAANATLGALLGADAAALVGRPVEELFTRAGRLFWQAQALPLLRTRGRADELYLPLRRADGTELPVLATAVRRTMDAAATGETDCVLVPVWERRRFEDALLAARRAAEAAAAELREQRLALEQANAQLQDQQVELELTNQQLHEQQVELEVAHQHLQETAVELAAQADELQATTAHLEERTEEAETARAVAEAERTRADAANASKSQFLANMSHELRTPLNAIGGYAQLLDMGIHGPVTDAQRHALGRVQAAQRHLLGLINDVLNYAKLEAGRVEYAIAAVDLRDVVADVAPLVEPQLVAKGLALDVRLPDEPCVVWADRDKLGQVLINLLSNATKFTAPEDPTTGAPGRVAVDVATRPGADDDTVFLRVTDTGRGIPRDRQAAVFEPFVQLQTGYARIPEGTGLGLAISRDLARGMGGDLRVRSTEREGSAFTVALRRVATPDGTGTDRHAHEERRGEPDRRAGDDRWQNSGGHGTASGWDVGPVASPESPPGSLPGSSPVL